MSVSQKPRLIVVGLILLTACSDGNDPEVRSSAALARACEYLLTVQSDDGAWRSETHALVRGGESWTPFVLHALLSAPKDECSVPVARVNAALDFIVSRVNEDGALGFGDTLIVEYPNYATAYGLHVLAMWGRTGDEPTAARMREYLLKQQFDERRGVDRKHPAYGGWGFGEPGLPFGSVGHVDVSHTRRVLQALRAAGVSDSTVFANARMFLGLHQKDPRDRRLVEGGLDPSSHDGGFFASSVVPVVNKSLQIHDSPPVFESYATATADGLLAMLAAGLTPGDTAPSAALDWLLANHNVDLPDGVNPNTPQAWQDAITFYHLAVRSEAYRAIGHPDPARERVVELLLAEQLPDGSFVNPHGMLLKEDDPMLATALAVLALQ